MKIYRKELGELLRKRRVSIGYDEKHIAAMTGRHENTIKKCERGEVTTIDIYVEYCQAVKFDLPSLVELKIPLKPKFKLSKEAVYRERRINVMQLIRELIEDGFFSSEKANQEVLEHLVLKGLLTKDYKTTNLAVPLKRLLDSKELKRKGTRGNYLYFK